MTTLYLVDDHQMMRDGLRALLEARGHTVLGESAEPTQALADLLRLRPQVLLLDLNLGGRSGLELQTEVQRRRVPVHTVVLTMSAQPHQVAEALRLGASAYVLKGSPASDLLAAIDAAVKGKKFFGADVADLALEAFTEQDDDPLSLLSPRERQIILMVVEGESSSAIGTTLHLSPKTVATYRSRLMKKLGVTDVTSLVRMAVRYKLIDSDESARRNRRRDDI
ncbi:MAG: DNA-binding response regulator [Comamonadaceae bacterium CG_4_9_14_3_um_filter_60_33]|nr:MAG: DNA-binding response regulator [Comamonadaceae bacterium CG2_30_59_20]PIY30192.1 MAG: DNA-binding response regulator [Comamonadaceae bacterium CG_4_10_14_3_um_filter_60_42]PJB43154.1 MAG: DNA-binding response regulator [Comamonadaceae bacterium CG_4_9_14_3_um_filter_60_33]